ncbi:glycine cleavage system protein GcvH [Priestia megaterium]|uniref:glycine cleavage system protein GcvH n=1 Tax=Priestia megaterium TaxID=1404 RepID=UPI0006ABDF83|nr:glycine cleavage system protein GcvH [Priestia megaterium]KOP74032.1 glycine cleavage system protein H [Bacillus sp. FJAT-21351]KQU18023.1 glycine cleavage system protein H [Bacillus sp. Leaf75]MED4761470.1 glycine cleavage system protein GcvH [Priestia megaterium]QLK07238.1 Glycine cleavage system H protein [Priestia megaterium]
MITPTELYYSKDHIWVKVEDNRVRLGITDYAQTTLGEIVFLDLPEEGNSLTINNSFGDVESIKTTSELIAPFNGQILKVNTELEDSPEYVNESPYDQGWMLEVQMNNVDDIQHLMRAKEYEDYVQEEN